MLDTAPHPELRILIVEDDSALRVLLTTLATRWGYKAAACGTAETALEKLADQQFNIVLTDIQMGALSGLALAEKIRESSPTTAIIIMTGYPSSVSAQKSQDLGAIFYMPKPLNLNELASTLKISATWNIVMLTDVATERYLALGTGDKAADDHERNAVKISLQQLLPFPGRMDDLLRFVHEPHVTDNPLYHELRRIHRDDSLKQVTP